MTTPRVVLHTNDPKVRALVLDAADPVKVAAHTIASVDSLPVRAHAVVTRASISSRTAALAAFVETAYVFVLPEALAALGAFITDGRPPLEGAADSSVVLVGSDAADLLDVPRPETVVGGYVQEVLF